MWRYHNSLLCVLIASLVIGCNRSAEEQPPPTPTPTAIVVSAQLNVESSKLATPIPQQIALSPIQLPTITPTPLATVTPTPEPYIRYDAYGTGIVVTPVPASPLVTCTSEDSEDTVIACYDMLLDMSFRYPSFMGQMVSTVLYRGSSAGSSAGIGYGYDYAFDYAFQAGRGYAGGRSRDFSAPRGPAYTDAEGFNGRTSEEICSWWTAAMCKELSPGAILLVILPQADWLCKDAMMFQSIPLGMLVLDLPQHPLIHGFSFAFALIPREEQEAFRAKWYSFSRCEPEEKDELRTAMDQLLQDLQAGTADTEIQQRYEALIQIAESIQSPFIAINR